MDENNALCLRGNPLSNVVTDSAAHSLPLTGLYINGPP
jgi:hypothetical protein